MTITDQENVDGAETAGLKDLPAHGLERWTNLLNILFLATDHDGDGPLDSAGYAAGDWGIDHTNAAFCEFLTKRDGAHWRGR
mgnify:CR=1 FL=1